MASTQPTVGIDRSHEPMALPARFGAGALMNYVSQGGAVVAAVVVTPLLLHHLGPSAFGIWILASSVIGYLELFEFGFSGSAIKLIAEDANVRPQRAVRTLNTALGVLLPLGILALGLGVAISLLAPDLFKIPPGMRGQAVVVFAVLATGLAVSIPGDVFGGALQGFQRFDLLSMANGSLVVVTAVASIAVVLGHGGLVPLAIATTVASILFHGVRWKMLRRVFPEVQLRPRLVDRARLRITARLSGWFLVNDVANAVTATSDLVVVTIIFGIRATAVYAVGFKLAQAAFQARSPFTWMLFPHASATARNKGAGALPAVVEDGTRIGLLLCVPATLVLSVLAVPGIRAWVGPGYSTSARVLVVLMAAFAVHSLVAPMSSVLYGAGNVRTMSLLALCYASCNLGLSIVFAQLLGPVGVAVGTLVATTLVWVPAVLVMGWRTIGVRPAELANSSILPHVVPGAAAAVVLVVLRDSVGNSVAGVLLAAAVGLLTYGALYLRVGASARERSRVFALARRILPQRSRSSR
jgi:O-antigen/teichoic acid export membrane protein